MSPASTPLVLLLAGPDGFRLTSRATSLLDSWLPASERDFALTRLSARGSDPATMTTAIDTPALFGDLRVVVIEEVEEMSAAVRDAILPLLAGIVAREDPTIRVLLLHRSEKAIDKHLASHAQIERFEAMRRGDAVSWLERETRQRHLTMAPGTAQAMVDAVGTDSGRLLQEVEKLSGLAGEGPITPEHVHQATAAAPPETPYALYDAVALRQGGAAQKTLSSLLKNPDYPGIRILIGLTRHIAQLGVVRARLDRGDPASDIAQALGYPGRTLVQAGQRWTMSQIDSALLACLDADRDLKTSRPETLTLTMALSAILS